MVWFLIMKEKKAYTNIENKYMDTKGERGGVGGIGNWD